MRLTDNERRMVAGACTHFGNWGVFYAWGDVPEVPNERQRAYILECLRRAGPTIGAMEASKKRLDHTEMVYGDLIKKLNRR